MSNVKNAVAVVKDSVINTENEGVLCGTFQIIRKDSPNKAKFERGEQVTLKVYLSGGIQLELRENSSPYFKVFNALEGPAVGDYLALEIRKLHINTFGHTAQPKASESAKDKYTYNSVLMAEDFKIVEFRKGEASLIPGLGAIDLSKQVDAVVTYDFAAGGRVTTASGSPVQNEGSLAGAANQ